MAPKLNVRMGLTRCPKPQYASEPAFVSQVQAQVKALTDDLTYIVNQFAEVSADIVIEAMQPTFDKSQNYVPQQTGKLKRSGYLENVGTKAQPKVEIGYAKGGIPRYGVLVHEMVEMPHRAPTRSKFLEAAINEDYGKIIDRLHAGYARFMGV